MGSEVKENAKRAMRELFGGLTNEPMDTVESEEEFLPNMPEEPAEDSAMFKPITKVEVTKIGGDTVITGSVKSSGALEIRGTVYGDIVSDDDVYLHGRVAGDILCKNFYHYTGAVKGNVTASNAIEIEAGGAVLGDLKAAEIRSDGRVSGNLVSAGKAELLENAIVVGDITTKHFVMRDSACLCGAVQLESPNRNMDNVFDDCFNF